MTASSPLEATGVVAGDASWEGPVVLTGDLFVPAGARLRVGAGCEVSAPPSYPGSERFVIGRRAFGGSLGLPRKGVCRIIVAGELEVLGVPRRPAVFSGSAWGGFVFLGAARARARAAVFRPAGGVAALGLDFCRVALEDCLFEEGAAEFGCFSRADLRRCLFRAAPRAALRVDDDASVRARACVVEGGRVGVEAGGAADLWWTRGTIRQAGFGAVVEDSARLAASRSGWSGCGVGISAKDRASVRVRSLSFEGGGAEIETRGRAAVRSA